MRTVVGSGVHGIAIEGTDDSDEMGVFVEPRENVYGWAQRCITTSGAPNPRGPGPGPATPTWSIYSLRKFLGMAIKGHPTILLPLFAPPDQVLIDSKLGDELRGMATLFLSQAAAWSFLGYMRAQHDRMMGGGKRNRVPNRPELIEKYGWDTKYGSHALRLAMQGWEVASEGHLSLPMRESERLSVLSVKRGETTSRPCPSGSPPTSGDRGPAPVRQMPAPRAPPPAGHQPVVDRSTRGALAPRRAEAGLLMAYLRSIEVPTCRTCGKRATQELINYVHAPMGSLYPARPGGAQAPDPDRGGKSVMYDLPSGADYAQSAADPAARDAAKVNQRVDQLVLRIDAQDERFNDLVRQLRELGVGIDVLDA